MPRRRRNNRGVNGGDSAVLSGIVIQASAHRVSTSVTVPKSVSMFPDIYTAWGDVYLTDTLAGAITTVLSAKANSFHLTGFQTNWAGAYGANVPSGLAYLFSSNTAAGSVAPYSQCCITDVDAEITAIQPNTANGAPPVRVNAIATTASSLSGAAFTQFAEQPYSVAGLIPALTSSGPAVFRLKFKPWQVLGISKERDYTDNPVNWFAPGVDPASLVYFHTQYVSADGASNATTILTYRLRYRFMLRSRNCFSTTVPS